MAGERQRSHPGDDILSGLVDDDAPTDAAIRDHTASCIRCSQRIAELRATRRLLQEVATQQTQPQHDIATRAIGRLRLRQTAIGNMNEVFAAVRALIRGIAALLGPPADAPGSLPRHDEGPPHGRR